MLPAEKVTGSSLARPRRFRCLLDLTFDRGESAAEAPEHALAADDLTPEAPSGDVEGQRQSQQEQAGRDPDKGGAGVAADGDARELARALEAVLEAADPHRLAHAQRQGLAPDGAHGQHLA